MHKRSDGVRVYPHGTQSRHGPTSTSSTPRRSRRSNASPVRLNDVPIHVTDAPRAPKRTNRPRTNNAVPRRAKRRKDSTAQEARSAGNNDFHQTQR